MSSTPKPGLGDEATDKTPSGAASDKSPIAPASVNLTVNGRVRTITLEPRMTLLDALREKVALTGTKKDAIAESVAHARCTSMAGASCPA
jgi:hypothetical protein